MRHVVEIRGKIESNKKLDLHSSFHTMPLLDIWTKSPDQLHDKQVHQLIAFAGGGKLLDDSPCSAEFRSFLATVSLSSTGTSPG